MVVSGNIYASDLTINILSLNKEQQIIEVCNASLCKRFITTINPSEEELQNIVESFYD